MRVLVTGSRGISDTKEVERILSQHIAVQDTVIHGGCKSGVDAIADDYASRYFNDQLRFIPDWDRHGKAAGPIRNRQMIEEGQPDLVVAIWDGRSKGTKHTIDFALAARIDVMVYFL